MKTIGNRAEVFHGNAHKTKGGLKKEDLKKNKQGYIVSIKQSERMSGGENPLRKKGLLQKKNSGKFGPVKEIKINDTVKEWSFF